MNAVLLLAAVAGGHEAHAWSHIYKVWTRDQMPITWYMGNTEPETIDWNYVGLTDGGAVQESFDRWVEGAPCANLSAEYGGLRESNVGGFDNDGIVTFSMGDPLNQLEGSTLGATLCLTSGEVVFNRNGKAYRKIADCDITYSETVGWATWEEVETGQCNGEYSLHSVTTHEIGHLLGLGHSCDDPADPASYDYQGDQTDCGDPDRRYATMFWSTGPCDNFQGGELRSDDIEGLYALYGPSCTFEATTERFGGAPLEVCFEVECNEDPSNFEWNFGDGNTDDSALELCHTYEERGQFSVGLTTTGSGETCGEWETTTRETAYVLVCGEPVPADGFKGLFTYDHFDGLIYQMYNQTDVSVYGCVDQVQWEVYEGKSVSGEPVQSIGAWSPKIQFEKEGTYTVVLNVGGPGGVAAAELTIEVEDKRGEQSRGCSSLPATGGLLGVFLGLGAAVRRRRD